jgi:hypothetical protein
MLLKIFGEAIGWDQTTSMFSRIPEQIFFGSSLHASIDGSRKLVLGIITVHLVAKAHADEAN